MFRRVARWLREYYSNPIFVIVLLLLLLLVAGSQQVIMIRNVQDVKDHRHRNEELHHVICERQDVLFDAMMREAKIILTIPPCPPQEQQTEGGGH